MLIYNAKNEIFLGVIYLKNFILTNWIQQETDNLVVSFSIHEQDRAMIRETIVDATVHAPELIRYFKKFCKQTLLKNFHINKIIYESIVMN